MLTRAATPAAKSGIPPNATCPFGPAGSITPREDDKVKSVDHLLDIYFKSVGRNSVLLLNVPPDRAGQISKFDVQRLTEFRAALDEIFKTDLCAGRPAHGSNIRGNDPRFAAANVTDGNLDTYWATDDGVTTGSVEIALEAAQPVNVINVQEYIPLGERVRRYHIEAKTAGQWRTVAGGTIIGHRNSAAHSRRDRRGPAVGNRRSGRLPGDLFLRGLPQRAGRPSRFRIAGRASAGGGFERPRRRHRLRR